MPTYSYQCTDCGDRFDAVQAFTEDTLTTCSKCAGRLRKLFGAVGVVFKGSGFYRNDSRAANGAKSGSSSGSGSGSKPSSDSGNGNGEKKSTDSGTKSNGAGEKSTSSSSSSSSAGSTPAGAAS